MRLLPYLLLPLSLAADAQPMLCQAEQISKKYASEIAKAPPPSPFPQTAPCLSLAPNWFTIDLKEIAPACEGTVFQALQSEFLWDALKEMGVRAVRMIGLKQGGAERTSIALDPAWGSEAEWTDLACLLQKKGLVLIGEGVGSATGIGPDFSLALKNVGDYPGLYRMVEIDKSDWKLLPPVPKDQTFANIPWLMLQELSKRGYVPEKQSPFTKTSDWNATPRVDCADGKARRWIYLKEGSDNPLLDWIDPSYASFRLAAGDSLDSYYRLGQKVFCLNASIAPFAQETLALSLRKMGAFSVQSVLGGLASFCDASGDLLFDNLTQTSLLHALLTRDAEALRLSYRLFLDAGIQPKRLVHTLQPLDAFSAEWTELLLHPKKRLRYYEEVLTGEALRKRLLKEDVLRLGEGKSDKIPLSTWPGYCAAALNEKDFRKSKDQIEELHLLLAFFYAMQPGAFSFSVSDLLGALPNQKEPFDLLGCNETTLYPSLPIQLKNTYSFASGLKRILAARIEWNIANGELLEVLPASSPSVILLIHRLPAMGKIHLLGVNFGSACAQEAIERSELRQSSAINIMNGMLECKPFDSSAFLLNLPPLSAKSIVFQPKIY